ncbi:MAG: FAD-dependent oxidoreductase [Hyphomicrobiaceae bacterium]
MLFIFSPLAARFEFARQYGLWGPSLQCCWTTGPPHATLGTVKNLVLVGGGHAHVHILKNFGLHPMPDVRVTLVTREVEAAYSGMLPGFIAGYYTRAQCHIDLRPLARFARAHLIHDAAVGLDLERRLVLRNAGDPVPYDVVSLDVGAAPDRSAIPGAAAHALVVKPIDRLAAKWEQLIAAPAPRLGLRFTTIGAGAAGIELTLAMRHRVRNRLIEAGDNPERASFTLISAGRILESGNARARRLFRNLLNARGVTLVENCRAREVASNAIICADGSRRPFDQVILATQSTAPAWLRDTGLPLDSSGFVQIDAELRALGCANVFAVGDMASSLVHPRPKAGVFAVRQGPPLAENLRRALADEPPVPFHPQQEYLSLISTGDRSAVAMRGSWAAQGRIFWYLKDWIDRRWIGSYTNLPLDS